MTSKVEVLLMFELDALNGGGGISNIRTIFEVRSRVLEKLLRIL